MPKNFTDFVAEVKGAADIVTIISRYVPLRKAGSRFVGVCPFHNDHSPSMNVTPQMGIYKCFVCGAGGDVFKFLQEYDKLSFIDALKLVAEDLGLKMPENFSNETNNWKNDKSARIMEANAFASNFFYKELRSSPEVQKYLKIRGVSDDVQKFFQLGLAPGTWDALLSAARQKGIQDQTLLEAGLIVEKNTSKKYDQFRNRLIFPIWNMSNRIIAFGGRTLEKNGKPKYLNSPESILYNKSRILYGFNFARSSVSASNEIILVEGYMDVLAMKQAGFDNVCAVSGTALTEQHAELLTKFIKKAYLFFDGDAAGRKAVLRSLPVLLQNGIEIKVPNLPGNEDPDSFAMRYGKEKTLFLLEKSSNVVEFLTQSYTDKPSSFSPEEKHLLFTNTLAVLENIQTAFVKAEYIRQLNEIFGVQIKSQIPAVQYTRSNYTKPRVSGSVSSGGELNRDLTTGAKPYFSTFNSNLRRLPETQLLILLLSVDGLCHDALEILDLDQIENADVKDLISRVLAFFQLEGKFILPLFVDELPQKQKSLIESIEILDFIDYWAGKKQFKDIVSSLEIRYIQKSMRKISKEIRNKVIDRYQGLNQLKEFQQRLIFLNKGTLGTRD